MGIRPMEMLLIGLGGCASFDVMSMLKKSRQQVTDCRTEVKLSEWMRFPRYLARSICTLWSLVLHSKRVKVKRAVELSAEKYCSASIMLEAAGVEMSHSYELIEPGY